VAGFLGLIAGTFAISIPWIVPYCDLIATGFEKGKYLYLAFRSCFLISVVAMALGLAAPKRIRLAVVLCGFATYWLMGTLAVK